MKTKCLDNLSKDKSFNTEAIRDIKKFIDEKGLPYYDVNLLKKKYKRASYTNPLFIPRIDEGPAQN